MSFLLILIYLWIIEFKKISYKINLLYIIDYATRNKPINNLYIFLNFIFQVFEVKLNWKYNIFKIDSHSPIKLFLGTFMNRNYDK